MRRPRPLRLLALVSLTGLLACSGGGDSHEVVAPSPPPIEACCPAGPGDWPQFRGPGRDGRSEEVGFADSWDAEAPREVWRVAGGPGFSGLSIQGDGVYTGWAENGREVLVRLDSTTGERSWTVDLGEEYEEEYGNGPRATPTVGDDGFVTMLSSRGVAVAVGAEDGAVRWSVDLRDAFDTGGIERRGFSSSPLLVGGAVVFNLGTDRSFVAVDRRDGSRLWVSGGDNAAVGSPMLFDLGGAQQIVSTSSTGLVGLEPSTGARLWDHPWPTKYGLNIASPVQVGPDRVLISSGYDQGAAVVEVASGASGWTAEEVWAERTFRNHWSTSVVVDGRIYGFDNAILKCLRVDDGSECWKGRGFGKGALLHADGKLFLLGEQGNVGMVRADPSAFELLGEVDRVLSGRCWTPPSLSNGVLYVRDGAEVVALRLPRRDTEQAPDADGIEPAAASTG